MPILCERTDVPNATRSRCDSPSKTCTEPDCGRPMRARGLCSTHYNQANSGVVHLPCEACGRLIPRSGHRNKSRYRVACSTTCRAFLQNGGQSCPVPDLHPSRSTHVPLDHPSRALSVCAVPPEHPSRNPITLSCAWCGTAFPSRMAGHRYCTRRCKTDHKRTRRRGQEAGSPVSYTWAEVMRVFLQFDRRCAYCEQRIDQPEPDHVVPLSRGGSNAISNILPSCKADNSDKRDLLLSDWAADRARRKLPTRTTTWHAGDPRVAHLAAALRLGDAA